MDNIKLESINEELAYVQKQIEMNKDPMIRYKLFMRKVDLIKIQKPGYDLKEIVKQLRLDIERERKEK